MTRPMVTVGISFLTATLVASFLDLALSIFLIFALLMMIVGVYLVKQNLFKQKRLHLVVVLVACLVGIFAITVKTNHEVTSVMKLAEQTVTVKAVVTDIFTNQKGTNGYELRVMEVNQQQNLPTFRTRLYSVTPLDVDYYDTVEIPVSFMKLGSTASFDTAQYYKQKQIYLLAFPKGEPIAIVSPSKKPIAYHFKMLNQALCAKVDSALQQPTSGIVKAMVLGDEKDIDNITTRAMCMAGIVHIVSISGLHVAILASFLFFLLKRVRLSHKLNVVIVLSIILGFVALTNFHVSTIRSAIMISVMLVGSLFGRPAESTNSLCLTGVLIVLWNPFAIRDIGFLLTFLATLGILTCMKPMSAWIHRKIRIRNKLLSFVITTMCCTISANLFILPVMLITFKNVSLVSPLTNLVVVPLTPLILIGAIILLFCSFVAFLTPVVQLLAGGITILVQLLTAMSKWVVDIPFSNIGMDEPFIKVWLFVSGGFLLSGIILYSVCKTKEEKPPFAKMIAGSLLVLMLFTIGYQVVTYNTLQITTIGSYETQAIVLVYQGRSSVINLKTDGYCNNTVSDFLDDNNIDSVDHYINLEQQTKVVSDTAFLLKTKKVENIVLDMKNPINEYVNNNCKLNSKVKTLHTNFSEKLGSVGIIKVIGLDENRGVTIECGKKTVCFTNSEHIAQNVNCDFLYFLQENDKFTKQFPSRYVILLAEYKELASSLPTTYFEASKSRLALSIHQNGNYTLREVN